VDHKITRYDKFAQAYLDHNDEKPYPKYYERPNMISLLPDLKGKKVLDLGCATGFYSEYCLNRQAEVISVDAGPKMIEHTAIRCSNKNKGYVHDISAPFDFISDQSIDIVICSLVLHYIRNWKAPLDEIHRMLKPGGVCLISTHHPINDYTLFNQPNYHDKRIVTDYWQGFKSTVKVQFFVRTLSQYIQPLLESRLTIKKIFEPMPIEELKEIDEKIYNKLSKKPGFLFFELIKS
jgi:SAM-dependent methyltransferase